MLLEKTNSSLYNVHVAPLKTTSLHKSRLINEGMISKLIVHLTSILSDGLIKINLKIHRQRWKSRSRTVCYHYDMIPSSLLRCLLCYSKGRYSVHVRHLFSPHMISISIIGISICHNITSAGPSSC